VVRVGRKVKTGAAIIVLFLPAFAVWLGHNVWHIMVLLPNLEIHFKWWQLSTIVLHRIYVVIGTTTDG
jgi:hypothetical protein